MDRRDFIKTATATGLTSVVGAAGPVRGRAGNSGPRQAIVIMGESVRYDMLNCNKQTGLKTPNLDRIAAQGARFDRAYNCQPVCSSARAAAWTGSYPHSNGMWGNSMTLGMTEHTIGQRLNDHAIHCAFMGKWHLSGTDYFDSGIAAPGWDPKYWYDMRNYLSELSPRDRMRSRKAATGLDPTWTAEMCYGHRVTNRAMEFLGKHGSEDFLLVIAYDEPHGPCLCPIEYSRMYANYVFPEDPNRSDPLTKKPADQQIWAGKRLDVPPTPIRQQHYFGAHTFIDYEIGRVLDQIEASAPNALVIYTSDHGIFLGSHRLDDKGPAMYEEITHVPFLAKCSGMVPPNVTSSSLVSHIDLAGTLMEFFGFEVPKTMEGGSMLAVLKDPNISVRKEVFIEFGRFELDLDGFGAFQPIRCICDGRYKLAINLMVTDELYDLQTDPNELSNLIESSEHISIRNNLHDRLLNWMNTTRDPFRGYYWGRRTWRPEYRETWAGDAMVRNRESDGYLPRELDYETGMPFEKATREKPGSDGEFNPQTPKT
jgi:uncharacterized sulfatase